MGIRLQGLAKANPKQNPKNRFWLKTQAKTVLHASFLGDLPESSKRPDQGGFY